MTLAVHHADFFSYHQQLLSCIAYLAPDQRLKVEAAFCFALQSHQGQKRDSGESYIIHPLVTATILANLHCDWSCLAAALLHDVVEDTGITLAQIEAGFGREIATLVDGVTKLPKISKISNVETRKLNLRKMLLAMTQDIRIVLIKLADRLHNMRTLQGIRSAPRRAKIARDALEIYTPIAQRLGVYKISTELADLSFEELYPHRYRILNIAIERLYGKHAEIIEQLKNRVENKLHEYGIADFAVVWRIKNIYSLYRKMIKRHSSFMEITDIYGMRITVQDIDSCYRVLGIIHQLYKPIPGKFKDYIALPKQNGYQSLHTVLLEPSGFFLEVQIRTQQMDYIANFGVAAHWRYKADQSTLLATDGMQLDPSAQRHDLLANQDNASAATIPATAMTAHTGSGFYNSKWIRNLLAIQLNNLDPIDFIDDIKDDLWSEQISVFTPKGDVIELSYGSTPIDFAYAIHTNIGHRCSSATVNHQFVPLSTLLKSGQTVAIITSPDTDAAPDLWWLNFVATSRAKCAIRRYWHNQPLAERVALGRRLLKRAFSCINLDIKQISNYSWNGFLRHYHWHKRSDFYAALGSGELRPMLTAYQLVSWQQQTKQNNQTKQNKLTNDCCSVLKSNSELQHAINKSDNGPTSISYTSAIKGALGVEVKIAECCMPVLGDNIVGYLNAEYQLEVHLSNCKHFKRLATDRARILAIEWAEKVNQQFPTVILIRAIAGGQVRSEIEQIVVHAHSEILQLQQNIGDRGYQTIILKLLVNNIQHLEKIMRHISGLNSILGVIRKN